MESAGSGTPTHVLKLPDVQRPKEGCGGLRRRFSVPFPNTGLLELSTITAPPTLFADLAKAVVDTILLFFKDIGVYRIDDDTQSSILLRAVDLFDPPGL